MKVRCTCGKWLSVRDALVGKTVRCPLCGGTFKATASSAGMAEQPSPETAKTEYGVAESKCPRCGVSLAPGAQVCVECGTHLATGVQQQPTEQPESKKEQGQERKVAFIVGSVAAAVIVVGGIVFAWTARDRLAKLLRLPSKESREAPTDAETTSGEEEGLESLGSSSGSGTAAQRSSGGSIPVADITLDGRADDWSNVSPARCKIDKSIRATYDVRQIKVARGEDNLYLLFELGLGVGEKFENERKTGKVFTGALGYLDFATETGKYRLWIPTGFSQTIDTKAAKTESVTISISYDLSRADPGSNEYEETASRSYPEDSGYIAFQGKYLELKIPLNELNITPDSRILGMQMDEM